MHVFNFFFAWHAFREGNQCADKFANLGFQVNCFTWWNEVPPNILLDFTKNKLRFSFIDIDRFEVKLFPLHFCTYFLSIYIGLCPFLLKKNSLYENIVLI